MIQYNFCTLFDSYYLSRGLALYHSLEKVCPSFHLYIFAFDDACFNVLQKIPMPHATVISMMQFEDPDLLSVKGGRTRAEYCWTSTSSTILYVLKNYTVESCTYIDADLFFYASPAPLFEEMGDKSVLITEHRYTPRYDKSRKSGKYCVQFVTFKNDEKGLTALRWWRDRCLEWCYDRHEDGKFGDQKYLDDWTTRFPGIHVLQHLGGGIAAWNVQQYDFIEENGKLFGNEKSAERSFEVIFYHFHYLRFFKEGRIELGRRILSDEVIRIFYKPYVKVLEEEKHLVQSVDPFLDSHGTGEAPLSWKTPILFAWRKLAGVYHIYELKKLLED